MTEPSVGVGWCLSDFLAGPLIRVSKVVNDGAGESIT